MTQQTEEHTYEDETTNEFMVRFLMISALYSVYPNLKPKNIIVKEKTFKPDLHDIFSSLQSSALLGGQSQQIGVQTSIRFVDVDMDFDNLKALKNILDDLTGVWHSYSTADVCHHGSIATLLGRVDAEELTSRIKKSFKVGTMAPAVSHDEPNSQEFA